MSHNRMIYVGIWHDRGIIIPLNELTKIPFSGERNRRQGGPHQSEQHAVKETRRCMKLGTRKLNKMRHQENNDSREAFELWRHSTKKKHSQTTTNKRHGQSS